MTQEVNGIQSEASLMRRIDELLGANTAEVLRRRELKDQIDAITRALDAAERSSWNMVTATQCECGSCIVIRGIRAFIKESRL